MTSNKKSASKSHATSAKQAAVVVEPPPEPKPQDSLTVIPDDVNAAIWCAMKGKTQKFIRCFEDPEDPFNEDMEEMLQERDDDGRSALDLAAIFGHISMIKEIVNRGFNVNSCGESGYTALHYAAAWNKLQIMKTLVECGALASLRTENKERARDIAVRYTHFECVEYLEWAEARQAFQISVKELRDIISDPEKIQGKLSRDEKKQIEQICTEREHWLETQTTAITQDFIDQKKIFDDIIVPYMEKINAEVVEAPPKKK